ncbi:MAG: hypothetical protein V3V20_02690, partial [Algisphaera sp.]
RYTWGMRNSGLSGVGGMLLLLAAACSGCAGSPFSVEAPVRSPYERNQILRGESRPSTEIDSFGRSRPALRSRLAPLDPSN